MNFIKYSPSGKPQILKREALVSIRNKRLPNLDDRYTDILDEMDMGIKQVAPRVTTGALSNAHGDWYEWLLAIEAWNLTAEKQALNVAVLLPNKMRLDLANLYTPDIRDKIFDLRRKVEDSSTVQLITSNPDFVIVKRRIAEAIYGPIEPIASLTEERIDALNTTYQSLVGNCNFEDIVGYLSVKTSFRPDRRLQIPHEGSLMKAIYVHLQTREWILNPPGLRYYAMATVVNAPDREALNTVATHSITTVSSKPEPAVDAVFEINSPRAAADAFESILS